MAQRKKEREILHEDIPQDTKATVKRLLGRMARQKGKLIVVVAATLLSSAAFAALPLAVMPALSPVLFLVVLVSLTVSMLATGYVSRLAQRAYGENLASMGALTGKIEEI